MSADILVFPDLAELTRQAAVRFVSLAAEAVAARGRFTVALSGGGTPTGLYRLLAEAPYRDELPWPHTHLFWGDERCVPPDHPESNYRQAQDTFIGRVPIPAANVHRILGELDPDAAAQAYTAELRAFFGNPWPAFDLVLLGMGEDGHIAALFPGSPAMNEAERPVVATTGLYQDRPAKRVTLTLPAINAARQIVFLVAGADKAPAVDAVLHGPPAGLPAQQLHPAGRLIWLLDEAAAHLKP
jgi:6-phosphogluconolactonase